MCDKFQRLFQSVDYIMANPPFNLKGWYNDNLKNDVRWADYQTPPESNANYASKKKSGNTIRRLQVTKYM